MIEFIKNDKNEPSSSHIKQKEANAYGEFSEDEDVFDEEYVAP